MYHEQFIEPEIATTQYNMFLYGRNTPQREQLLKSIAEKYPFYSQENKSCVVYVDEFGLPVIEEKAISVDDKTIGDITFRYLDFCIVEAVLRKVVASIKLARKDIKKIIDYFYADRPINRPKNVRQLFERINASKDGYKEAYIDYCANGDKSKLYEFVQKLEIQFIYSLNDFLRAVQNNFQNQEPFIIILDRKCKISYTSVRAVNSLISRGNISYSCIKVACECGEWETDVDYYGNFNLYPHEYIIVELDDSFQKRIEELSRRRESTN